MTDFIAIALGLRSPTLNFGGSGGSGGPTVQQQQLQTQQATENANLNLEENSQRKSILNAMMGMRVFRGSALSRATRGNTPGTGGEQTAPAPSRSQISDNIAPISVGQASLLDSGSGNTSAGGTGASGGATAARAGGYAGGGGSRGGGGGGGR